MAMFEITKAQVKAILFDHIREDCNTADFHNIVMYLLKEAKQWNSFDWYSIKLLVDRMEKRTPHNSGEY